MSGEAERIADQHRRAFNGPAWHGPAVLEVLEDVGVERASARPIADGHTIWEIVLHLAAWEETVARRLRGEAVRLTDEQDWPPPGPAEEGAWRRALDRLEARHRALAAAIAGLTDSRLAERVSGMDYSAYAMVHGEIQHALYHAGQIAVLKKG